MLQEVNKFREHQARQNLIDLLELELKQRRNLLARLQEGVAEADAILEEVKHD